MKVVLDTNVIVSGFLFNGPPNDIISKVFPSQVEFFTSEKLVSELIRTLCKSKLQYRMGETKYTPELILEKYRRMVTVVSPIIEFLEPPELRDPEDLVVLATAYAANARIIVSGDNDLLSLNSFAGIRIVTPSDFLKIIRSRK
jgi:putative PIN family toxin of toxin-antitoxin system